MKEAQINLLGHKFNCKLYESFVQIIFIYGNLQEKHVNGMRQSAKVSCVYSWLKGEWVHITNMYKQKLLQPDWNT